MKNEMSYVLAIDQGTTGSTSVIIDSCGAWIGAFTVSFEQHYPKPGWVEHDPDEIWESVVTSIKGVIKKFGIDPKNICAIGITNQRETTLLWDKETGDPVYKAIVWQCRRTTDRCDKLKKSKSISKMIREKTGLLLDPYFSATKIEWIIKNGGSKINRLLRDKKILFGTPDTYLLWKLTGGRSHFTEPSNASRTMLMNIKSLKWDSKLLELFNIPESILPAIRDSNTNFGSTHGLGFLPDGIPITGILGDQQAALFGQFCLNPGDVKCTFGTGSFILANTGSKVVKSRAGLLSTVAWKLDKSPTYALEGGAFICGAAVQWLRDGLGIIGASSDVEGLAQAVKDSGGVEFIPALTGLGAPYWDPRARGLISGLTRGATKSHIARATLDAMALQNSAILQIMEKDMNKKFKSIAVDGGASVNNLLLQLQSDYSSKIVLRPQVIETTAYGAALMAGLGVGLWKTIADLKKIKKIESEFRPKISKLARLKRVSSWNQAIKRTQIK